MIWIKYSEEIGAILWGIVVLITGAAILSVPWGG